MDKGLILAKTCQTGMLCAAIGIAVGAALSCGTECLRVRSCRALDLPASLVTQEALRRHFFLLVKPFASAAQPLLEDAAEHYARVLDGGSAADASAALQPRFEAYFVRAGILTAREPAFGTVPKGTVRRNAYVALLLHALAARRADVLENRHAPL